MIEDAMEEIRRMSKPHPVKVTPKTICAMYCLGFEECPEFKNNNEIEKCGCYAVLKDRHGEEILNVMKGEKL